MAHEITRPQLMTSERRVQRWEHDVKPQLARARATIIATLGVQQPTLEDWRVARGLSQTDLARLTGYPGVSGISNATVSNIENGKHVPQFATRARLALALRCDVEDIAWPTEATTM